MIILLYCSKLSSHSKHHTCFRMCYFLGITSISTANLLENDLLSLNLHESIFIFHLCSLLTHSSIFTYMFCGPSMGIFIYFWDKSTSSKYWGETYPLHPPWCLHLQYDLSGSTLSHCSQLETSDDQYNFIIIIYWSFSCLIKQNTNTTRKKYEWRQNIYKLS